MIGVFKNALYRLKRIQTMQRMALGVARASAVRAMQPIDPRDPATWEASGMSQNGEDGIIDYLTQQVRNPNRYFVEIGASDGTENNSSWLAVVRRWRGLMVEGNRGKADYCRYIMGGLAIGVEVDSRFVTCETIADLSSRFAMSDPDFFSIDIDGIDWHIASSLLKNGFRPKVFAVEYNSCFGPERSLTIPYKPDFNFSQAHSTQLYYGVAIQAWRGLLSGYGYQFVTVETNGVNAFFVRPDAMVMDMLTDIKTRDFEENFFQATRHRRAWQGQFELIKHMPLIDTSALSD
jgi:hypothetical protein